MLRYIVHWESLVTQNKPKVTLHKFTEKHLRCFIYENVVEVFSCIQRPAELRLVQYNMKQIAPSQMKVLL
jgi:hypothetical protein